MDPLALTAEALREPWRLWTGHVAHYGWAHLAANLVALGVPLVLADRRDRPRLLLALAFLAPLLSLALLPDLEDGGYRGASGLACAAWTWVGLRLLRRRESSAVGLLLLGGLGLKLALETALGACLLPNTDGWRTLPAAHLWGSLLGLMAALPRRRLLRRA